MDSTATWWPGVGKFAKLFLVDVRGRANAALAEQLARRTAAWVKADKFAIRFAAGAGLDVVGRLVDVLRGVDPGGIVPPVSEEALEGLKFDECLPAGIATAVVRGRLSDERGVVDVLARATRAFSGS